MPGAPRRVSAFERRQHGGGRGAVDATPAPAVHRHATSQQTRRPADAGRTQPGALIMPRGIPLLHDYLSEAAARLPDKLALVSQDQRLTYGEIEARSNALAHT